MAWTINSATSYNKKIHTNIFVSICCVVTSDTFFELFTDKQNEVLSVLAFSHTLHITIIIKGKRFFPIFSWRILQYQLGFFFFFWIIGFNFSNTICPWAKCINKKNKKMMKIGIWRFIIVASTCFFVFLRHFVCCEQFFFFKLLNDSE